jgi:hypothetical protein
MCANCLIIFLKLFSQKGESIDYTAWQDMTELPANIFPKLISERHGEDDEDESDERDSSEESASAQLVA